MKRRSFLQNSLAAGLSLSFSSHMAAAAPRHQEEGILKPKRLAPGQTVGLVSPASNAWENEDIFFAEDILKSFGFKVKRGAHLFERNQYLAGSDQQRAQDINSMFADTSVNGIIALRGGYGTPRILPYIDYPLIAKNPKVLLGYSDLTGLLNAITTKTGLVTFHGPIAKQTFSEYTLAEFKKVLFEQTSTPFDVGSPPPLEDLREGIAEKQNRLTTIVPGKAKGALVGGNLSLMTALMGTPYEPDFKGRILFLEDVGEVPYRLDRMLTHLWLTGKLQQLAGVALGKFTEDAHEGGNSFSTEAVLMDRFKPLGIPCLRGLMIGHVLDQTTLPIGVQAELDSIAGTLKILESPLV